MTFWVISDTHFGHSKMRELCGRPDDFEERILRNVMKMVKEGDVLIHLGDVCIGDDAKWHLKFHLICRGKQWLIRGNHDKKSFSWYLDHGWDFVADGVELKMFGKVIALSHVPVLIPIDPVYVNVHGHHHANRHHPEDATGPNHRLVAVEHGYAPVKLASVV